ncbi:hypothetical protein [Anaerotalea alkaliphila]|uniref:Uncharacterized protein n=1 Tax=Anaerotalea alkaliphila TaxID=2662126 RepID=A0A7X5KMW3_9FIRM|nr:hypothetical protein [Anaerotalea alkaliphila]NDL67394.1 hypothetical protein [Anaerotalea alkaliphila]
MKPVIEKSKYESMLDRRMYKFPLLLIIVTFLFTYFLPVLMQLVRTRSTQDLFTPMLFSNSFFRGIVIGVALYYIMRMMVYRSVKQSHELESVTDPEFADAWFLPCAMGQRLDKVRLGNLIFNGDTYYFQPNKQFTQDLPFKGSMTEEPLHVEVTDNTRNWPLRILAGDTRVLTLRSQSGIHQGDFLVPDPEAVREELERFLNERALHRE